MTRSIAITFLTLTLAYLSQACGQVQFDAPADEQALTCAGKVTVPEGGLTVACSADQTYYDAAGCPTNGYTPESAWLCIAGSMVDATPPAPAPEACDFGGGATGHVVVAPLESAPQCPRMREDAPGGKFRWCCL
jgi:hypothetical protein